jgi:hypothetical protein
MLRRRKAEVLEQLPERVDNTLFMPMTPLQADHHEENRQVVARIVQRWRHTGFLSEKDQLRLHCSLQNMRMACNSSFLIDHETDDGYKADELLALLDDILDDPQAKVVVFSQWLRTHELIVRRLASAAGSTCCSTAACRAKSAARSSTASTTTPPAGCFSAPTPAASVSTCNTRRRWSSTWICRGIRRCSNNASVACTAWARRAACR